MRGVNCAEEPKVSRISTGLKKNQPSAGRIPAKVLLAQRARVTAGFAKELGSSHELCYGAGVRTEFHCWPILSISCLSVSRSSIKKASLKARSTCSVVPCTAAGSIVAGIAGCAARGPGLRTVFLDSSAVLAVILHEPNRDEALDKINTADRLIASRLLKVECERALIRYSLDRPDLAAPLADIRRDLRLIRRVRRTSARTTIFSDQNALR